jgi:hypothetical protein
LQHSVSPYPITASDANRPHPAHLEERSNFMTIYRLLSRSALQKQNAYDDLFALWKNADPGIPILNEARAEYARFR